MRGNLLKRFQFFIRWFVLIGVLTGIFFSSGEGVQLLPFPLSSDKNEGSSHPLQEEIQKSYTFSVHNFGNPSFLLKTKFQKKNKDEIAYGTLPDDCTEDAKFIYVPLEQNYKENELFYTFNFLISPSNRGPPTI